MRAFSLVELMVVVAIAALIIGLAAPSFKDYIVTQRLRSIHAQLATDLQFARAEAVSRASFVAVRHQFTTGSTGASCYIIFTRPDPTISNPVTCDCLAAAGSRCAAFPADTSEIRTVVVPNELGVNLRVATGQPDRLTFDPRTGGLKIPPADEAILTVTGFQVTSSADTERSLRAIVNGSGRARLCTPSGSLLGGAACP
jgi:prepilin-type N-terminal cleavage/methylation domain-containing protein